LTSRKELELPLLESWTVEAYMEEIAREHEVVVVVGVANAAGALALTTVAMVAYRRAPDARLKN
jgi:hypothetical protein